VRKGGFPVRATEQLIGNVSERQKDTRKQNNPIKSIASLKLSMCMIFNEGRKRPMSYCDGCYEKQLKIDRLKERIEHLEKKIKNRKRKEKEGYFGSSTPSVKKPFKENSSKEKLNKNGGAKPGHPGNGRKSISEQAADEIEYLNAPDICPFCGEELEKKGVQNRSIIDTESNKAKKKVVKCEKKRCPKCNKIIQAKPAALPKSLYGNNLVAQACLLHFVLLEGSKRYGASW